MNPLEHDWARRIEGGESLYDMRDRFIPFIAGLVERYKSSDTEVLCVAHGGVYQMMLPLVLKNVDRQLIEKHHFGYTSTIIAEPGDAGLLCVEWNGVKISNPGPGIGEQGA